MKIEFSKSIFENFSGSPYEKLLQYFLKLFPNKQITIIGKKPNGYSGVNQIDFEDELIKTIQQSIERHKVEVHFDSIWTEEKKRKWDILIGSSLIIFDCPIYNGIIQYEFYKYLQAIHYQGILLINYIWSQKEMRDNFWYKIPDENKIDLTHYGNENGTGLVWLRDSHLNWEISCDFQTQPNYNWTFVTAYYDLTECMDTYEVFEDQKPENYLKNVDATMSLPVPLVVYCDKKHYETLNSKRPEHLKTRTKWYFIPFEEIPFVQTYRMKVIENRIKNPYRFDSRNTASYYIFTMIKYWALQNEIENNQFQTEYFGWININTELFGFRNLFHFNNALSCHRNKFSACFIEYQPKDLVENYPEYFKFGRCSFTSSFITASKEAMKVYCEKIIKVFIEVLEAGYGHTDEQLYLILFFREPELFDYYLGDYSEIISNYASVHENGYKPIRLLLKHSFQHKNYVVAGRACEILLQSYPFQVDDNNLKEVIQTLFDIIIQTQNKSYLKILTDFLVHKCPKHLNIY